MKRNKHAQSVTRFRSGVAGAPEAMNTAPSVVAPTSIAGYGPMRAAGGRTGAAGKGTPSPTISGAAPGKRQMQVPAASAASVNAPSDSPRGVKGSGGPSRSGPGITQGGTSSPRSKPGPGGLGLSGSKYPPVG